MNNMSLLKVVQSTKSITKNAVNSVVNIATEYNEFCEVTNNLSSTKKFRKEHPVVSAFAVGTTVVASVYLSNPQFWDKAISNGVTVIKDKMSNVTKKIKTEKQDINTDDDSTYLEYLESLSKTELDYELSLVTDLIQLYEMELDKADDENKETIKSNIKKYRHKYSLIVNQYLSSKSNKRHNCCFTYNDYEIIKAYASIDFSIYNEFVNLLQEDETYDEYALVNDMIMFLQRTDNPIQIQNKENICREFEHRLVLLDNHSELFNI